MIEKDTPQSTKSSIGDVVAYSGWLEKLASSSLFGVHRPEHA
jgi:hypothetical protein